MGRILDVVYAGLALTTAPWWMRKARSDWGERFGKIEPLSGSKRPRLLVHAVSVGEVGMTPPLVKRLSSLIEPVVSVGTDTGIARARELFAETCPVVRYPLDASWAVRRFLDAVRPDAVALVELELWPHFVEECDRRGIPVAVINGRLSERSFKGYRRGRVFIGRSFRRLAFAAVQDEDYAGRFRAMGVPAERCHVVGSMKWDSAHVCDGVPGSEELAEAMRLDRSKPLIVAGSTAPGEHELLHTATPPGVQLMCAPRKPEWRDQAALELPGCVRRTDPGSGDPASERFMLDTIGELRAAYSLADVVVLGRSFGKLFGSDPMEPAGLAKPVVIGPAVEDFRSVVKTMDRAGAILRTTAEDLPTVIAQLIADPERRTRLGRAARQCVLDNQGATERHAELLLKLLGLDADQRPEDAAA